MKEYTIVYTDGSVKDVECVGQKELIEEFFAGDEEKFKKDVKRLSWRTISMHYILDVSTGETTAELISADVNPYGWRKE